METMEVPPTTAEIVSAANLSEISRRTGIHLSHISRIMSGKRTASSRNLSAIAGFLGVPMDELYAHLMAIRNKHTRNTRNTRNR